MRHMYIVQFVWQINNMESKSLSIYKYVYMYILNRLILSGWNRKYEAHYVATDSRICVWLNLFFRAWDVNDSPKWKTLVPTIVQPECWH